MAAVSVRKIRGPKLTDWYPFSLAWCISVSDNPPSGPINKRNPCALYGCLASGCSAPGASTSLVVLVEDDSQVFRLTGAFSLGIILRPLCSQAPITIFCHCWIFFSQRDSSSFTVQRSVITGVISDTPSSTLFWRTVSILSPLDTPWPRCRWRGDSLARERQASASTITFFLWTLITCALYSLPSPLKSTMGRLGFMRSTVAMWCPASSVNSILALTE